MKKPLQILTLALLMASSSIKAQVSVNFEPVQGQSLSSKQILESQNWQFPQFDINPEGAAPIAGVQSLGHITGLADPGVESGVVTPLLTLSNAEFVSFSYKLHRPMMAGCRRWFIIDLIDNVGNRTRLDSVEVSTDGSLVTYAKTISGMAGNYAIFAKVEGEGCNAKLILDDFFYSGTAGFGGQAPLQKISGVKNIDKDAAALTVYPNPANSNLNVNIQSENNQEGDVEVFNMTGEKVIAQNQIALNAGKNNVNLEIGNLTAGNYIVSVRTASGVTTKRFAKL